MPVHPGSHAEVDTKSLQSFCCKTHFSCFGYTEDVEFLSVYKSRLINQKHRQVHPNQQNSRGSVNSEHDFQEEEIFYNFY